MIKISPTRILNDLKMLGQIGATENGGVSRTAMSSADVAGREWFKTQVLEAGLIFRQDGAGNLSALLPRTNPHAKTVLMGSHLDTVPNGGRFDGALGVLSALEVLRTFQEAGFKPTPNLEAISFTDEEGTHVSLLGSRAVAGALSSVTLKRPRSGRRAFEAGMARLGISPESILGARRDPQMLAAYVEVHIEQGTRLEQSKTDVGVVTSIVGIRSHWLTFKGQVAHAGTTSMEDRADALWGGAVFVDNARRLVVDDFTPGVLNVGQIEVDPGSFNIVPGLARLSLEFRHSTETLLDQMQADLFALAEETAKTFGLELTIEQASSAETAPMDEKVITAIEKGASTLSLSHKRLPSFAGHDAQSMSRITPTGMLFVPSVNGISHNPAEHSTQEAVVNGANTLLHTVLALVHT